MSTRDLKSFLVPLLVAFGLTILAVLIAVYLGYAWD
jgi:hypothetical protein